MSLNNSFLTQVAIYPEGTIGDVPVDAAAWAAAELAGDAWRFFFESLAPDFILGTEAVANADMMTRVGEHLKPHQGLPTADGGSAVSRMWGTGSSFVTGASITETALGWLLGHALGGNSTGNHATITGVTSQTVFEVDDADDMVVGQVIGFENQDDAGRVFPARIVAISGVEITIDRVMPWTVVIDDHVIGGETAYFDQAALATSTCSLLLAKSTDVWTVGGAHFALDSIAVERGQQPKLNWSILGARGYPPGTTGSVTLPAFTETIQGLPDVRAIGRDTKARLVAYGATTVGEYTLHAAAISVGVPVIGVDTVTEVNAGSPGRDCYRTEPAETTITLTVAMTAAEQTKWTAGTYLAVSYYQVAAVGFSWCVDGVRGFLMQAPTPMVEDVNKYEIVIRLSDDVTKAADGEMAASKIVIGRY